MWLWGSLKRHLQSCADHSLYYPRAAPSEDMLTRTYEQWFKPVSSCRRDCGLPVSDKRMQFTLGSYGLPVAVCRLSEAGHLGRADRVCTCCGRHAIGDEMHMIFERSAIQSLRACHADLFRPDTDTI